MTAGVVDGLPGAEPTSAYDRLTHARELLAFADELPAPRAPQPTLEEYVADMTEAQLAECTEGFRDWVAARRAARGRETAGRETAGRETAGRQGARR